jgi:hypothetical protein
MLGTVTAPIFSVEMRICPSARKSAAPPPTRPSPGQAPCSRSDPRTSISTEVHTKYKASDDAARYSIKSIPCQYMSSSSPSPANSRDKSIPPRHYQKGEARAFPFLLPPNCDEARFSPSALISPRSRRHARALPASLLTR